MKAVEGFKTTFGHKKWLPENAPRKSKNAPRKNEGSK